MATPMTAIPSDKLDKVLQRWEYLQYELSQRVNQTNYAQLSKEFSDLGPLVETIRALRQTEAERSDLTAMLNDPAADKELAAMARDELAALGPRVSALEQELRLQLLPKDSADEKSAILEVRAGTGGDEAALFAADLFRMYSRYADIHGWKTEIISLSENDLGGYKEMVASITGKGVFARLKFESGVHRVQRVPATEASGRIHTSAATVAVLPEAEEVEFDIKPEDIRIDTMRAGGAGGQHVNKTDSAVRITHCRLASSWCPPRSPSTRTGVSPCRCCARASTSRSARGRTARAPPSARARSAAVIARSASAPTISRRGASPIIASASPCTSSTRSCRAPRSMS
jgi:peptide chain release factor 1